MYLKYWNNNWKGKRAGRYDGAKECKHIVPTGNKLSGKEVKQGTLKVDANYFTTYGWKKKWDRNSGEGGAGQKCPGGEEGLRQIYGHETGGKRVHPKYNKRVCSTG